MQNNTSFDDYFRILKVFKNENNRQLILKALDNLPQAPVAFNDEMNVFIENHALFGLGIGFIDTHLISIDTVDNQCKIMDAR